MSLKGLSVSAVPGALGPLTLTSSAVSGRMAIPGASGIPGNSVLLVTNLNPDVSGKMLLSLRSGMVALIMLKFVLRNLIKIINRLYRSINSTVTE